MAHTGPTPHQFDKWNCQVFINIKNFYFHTTFLRHQKEVWEYKIYVIFPSYSIGRQGLRLRFVELPTYTIFISLAIEISKNNIDAFRVFNKQYYKIILTKRFYQTNLTFSESCCQILQAFSRKILPNNATFSLRCE